MTAPLDPSQVLAVIPARWGSHRFPGKPLAPLAGSPVLAHVVRAALAATRVGAVLVATDHEEIARAATEAGAEAVRTREDHPSGSDRIGEAIRGRAGAVVLNVQGDEPLLPPEAIDRLVTLLEGDPEAAVSTLACPIPVGDPAREDPNVVKVVLDARGRALYFSRASIPGRHPAAEAGPALRHVGLYGYRREGLERFLAAPPTPLERAEGLEQLRLLENGERIAVGIVEALAPGVDTPEDLERCARWLREEGGLASPAGPV